VVTSKVTAFFTIVGAITCVSSFLVLLNITSPFVIVAAAVSLVVAPMVFEELMVVSLTIESAFSYKEGLSDDGDAIMHLKRMIGLF